MSNIKNSVTLIGHLGQDPTVNTTSSGREVVNFSLATNKTWKNATGEKQQRTDWHRCTAWGKLASIIGKFGRKGQQVAVRGELTYSEWERDGQKHKTAEINLDQFVIMGGTANTGTPRPEQVEQARQPAGTATNNAAPADDDDLPF